MYSAEFDSSMRQLECKIEFFLDGIQQPPQVVTNEDETIVSVQIDSDLAATEAHPVGEALSDVVSIMLMNTENQFTPTNPDSIFYNKKLKNVPIKVWMRNLYTSETWHVIGVYYLNKFSCPAGTPMATITGYDKLFLVLGKVLSYHKVLKNIGLYQLVELLLQSAGLTPAEYLIDEELRTQTGQPYYSFDGCTLHDCLNELGQQHFFYTRMIIDANGNEVLNILAYMKKHTPICVWNDEENILTNSMEFGNLLAYNVIKVQYNIPAEIANHQLASWNDLELPVGTTQLDDIPMQAPLLRVYYAHITSDGMDYLYVNKVKYSPSKLQVWVTNNNATPQVAPSLVVGGAALEPGTSAEFTMELDPTDPEKLELVISNNSIMSKDRAIAQAVYLRKYLEQAYQGCEITHRGNPTVCVGDVVTVQDMTRNVSRTVMITRQTILYSGGMSATSTGTTLISGIT